MVSKSVAYSQPHWAIRWAGRSPTATVLLVPSVTLAIRTGRLVGFRCQLYTANSPLRALLPQLPASFQSSFPVTAR